ncbi:MAG: Kae1-associated kinase Bud32 [Desulfurococcaceae archaeon]
MASIEEYTFLSKGAEAEIYLVDFFGLKAVAKKRVSKTYRNPEFDKLFIRNRTKIEGRVLSELYVAGLRVPAVYLVDEEHGVILMEYIEGERLSNIIGKLGINDVLKISREIGKFAAQMHNLGIYHGDYTLANILLNDAGIVVIDFGLSGFSDDIEEYAIDLHLVVRSINATAPHIADVFVKQMLNEYKIHYVGGAEEVVHRMREISARGRYIDRELRKSIMREKYVT